MQRGTGRTRRQMQAAPRGAFYIWPVERLAYPRNLAVELDRTDLQIAGRDVFDRPHRLRGHSRAIVVDHACVLTPRQRDVYHEFCARYSRDFEDEQFEQHVRRLERDYLSTLPHLGRGEDAPRLVQFRTEIADLRRAHYRDREMPVMVMGLDPGSGFDRSVITVDYGATRQVFELPDLRESPNLTATQVSALQAEAMRHLQAMHDGFVADFVGYGSAVMPVGGDDAQARGRALLEQWLTPAQREELARDQCFEVVGEASGKRYRIREGRQQNIDELDVDGNKVATWCFLPMGQLVAGDCMLAQKIALETDERAALRVANRFGLPGSPITPEELERAYGGVGALLDTPRRAWFSFDEAAPINDAVWSEL